MNTTDLKADVRVRLQQIAQLCDDLSMTLESQPDVMHTYLSRQAQLIKETARRWVEAA